jgi:hypothetical protein
MDREGGTDKELAWVTLQESESYRRCREVVKEGSSGASREQGKTFRLRRSGRVLRPSLLSLFSIDNRATQEPDPSSQHRF